ncbi:hypothetical protein IQ13_4233 [Lacibacter cauensis]|uniref:Uncharacterized protein n=1 Tax=Lacibacter cauensis TaxID=510947 RepID=A0A562S9K3_9BACT|nr:hypothetical protein [Lacibacter cauensis]TWI77989.1 hypothetical protein IQ13_4233 [Lacibacter cauensis]
MKQLFPLLIVSMLVISCSNQSSDQTLAFIPGTYVRSEQNEYGQIEDTINISIQHQEVNSFIIEQRWQYERILDGIHQQPEYKMIIDLGFYYPEKKLMKNQRTLVTYSFDLEKNVLYFGSLRFQKIK